MTSPRARSIVPSTPTIIVDPTLLPQPTRAERVQAALCWLRHEWPSCLAIVGSTVTMVVGFVELWSRLR